MSKVSRLKATYPYASRKSFFKDLYGRQTVKNLNIVMEIQNIELY